MTLKQIAAGKFKAQCLAMLDNVGVDGIVITRRGKPVAKLMPIRAASASLIGALKGKVSIRGETLSTGLRWNAESWYPRPAARRRRQPDATRRAPVARG
jgi:antitoxin (DNA-binding transcriptional repressor) of toxin-antitoxin stability system